MARNRKKSKSKRSRHGERQPTSPDQMLIDALDVVEDSDERIFTMSLDRAGAAIACARQFPQSQVTCNFFDLFLATEAGQGSDAHGCPNLQITCTADIPAEGYDVVALPFRKTDPSELTRELVQSAFLALKTGGKLIVSFANPRDHWLHEMLRAMFPKVTRRAHGKAGVVLTATKRDDLKKIKDYAAEFDFRDGENIIHAISRPGVFSHRRLDHGARALMKYMEVHEGDRVLDIGCGAGVVSLAAACRAPGVTVHAVDSNPRALDSTLRGAERNGLTNITTQLCANGRIDHAGTFDLAVGNPPYFSNYRIAAIFIRAGLLALKPGGTLAIVTKSYDWFGATMSDYQDDVAVHAIGNYYIVRGTQRTVVPPDRGAFVAE